MRSWFARRSIGPDPVTGPDELEAYKDGRSDERRRAEADGVSRTAPRADIADAYERGRREARSRRRGSPLLTLIILLLVLVGAGIIYLTVRQGSVSGAGQVVDQSVQAPVREAADRIGNGLQNAGETVKQRAGSGPK